MLIEEMYYWLLLIGLLGFAGLLLGKMLIGKQSQNSLLEKLDKLENIEKDYFSLQLQTQSQQANFEHQSQQLTEKNQQLDVWMKKFEETRSTLEQLEKRYVQLQSESAEREASSQKSLSASQTYHAQQLEEKNMQLSRLEASHQKILQATQEQLTQFLQEKDKQIHQLSEKLTHLQEENSRIETRFAQLETEANERTKSHQREVANFEEQKKQLSEHFKLLSQEILEAKAKALQEKSQQSLSSIMQPFQQSMDGFKKEIQEIHHREALQQGELRKELEHLKNLNQQITKEASELATALRGQKKLQGNWGELILENILERSGLRKDMDYRREVSLKTQEGERQRPDVVVYLPQDKHLIIDSKVSLSAYTRYVNAEDEQERLQALQEHVSAIKDRLSELANKDYYKLPGLNSPEVVFMFIPIESAFVEALKADEGIFQQAIENHILIATPTTLLTSLNIVRQLWRYEEQNKNTVLLAEKAEGVFKKLNTFLSSFEKIKKSLDGAQDAYQTAENQLLSGRGNLVKQVNDFKKLAPAIHAELPSQYLEKAELEIELHREG